MTKTLFKIAINCLKASLLIVLPVIVLAQNINRTNKMGPMGLQVNTSSGNLFIPRNDLSISARGLNLDMSFFYNSFNFSENTGYGNGWNFIYHIVYRNDSAEAKTVIWGDGREDTYSSLGNAAYKAPIGFFSSFSEYEAGKFLLTAPEGTKFFFDNATLKRITKVSEPNGNFISFQYTDTLLTSITNAAGQTISLVYTNGKLTSLVDAITAPTRTYSYSYDEAGNLKQVKDPLNGTMEYTYLVNGPMKTAQDQNKNVVDVIYYNNFSVSEVIGCNKRISFSYDTTTLTTYATDYISGGNNQVTKYEYTHHDGVYWLSAISGNCCGFEKKFEFDAQGNKTKETDARGNSEAYTYDNRGNALTVTDALDQTIRYTYSTDYNDMTSFTDQKGFVSTMDYDSKGNLIKLTEPENVVYTATYNSKGDIISSTDPKGNVFSYNYDTYGNPVNVSGPNGYKATLGYDARGNELLFTDAKGNSSLKEYDILNRMKKITDPLNNTFQFNYDAEGNVVSFINQSSETILFGHDASNRLVKFTDVIGNKSIIQYDEMDNVKSITNALGQTKKFNYDNLNRLAGVTDALANSSSMNYDGNGNLISTIFPNGQTIQYTYDALNRVASASDVNGKISDITYDKNSNVTSYKNASGAIITLQYDASGRPVSITDALGNRTEANYDKNNNVTSVKDPNGNTSSYTYDELNRLKTHTDNNGNTITVGYDVVGNIVSATDENNNTTTFSYDNLNRLTKTIYPGGTFSELSYNSKSDIISKRVTDGSVIQYKYDSLNRVVSKHLPNGHVFTYTYDKLGRVLTATNNSGTVLFAYDALNRIVSETFDGRTVSYSYNITGRSKTTVYPDSTIITKTFDTRNRMTSVAKNNVTLVSYTYNNIDQVLTKTFGNGVTTNYQYDFANRLINISTGNGNVQNSFFTYDKVGNKTSINRLNNPGLSEQFTYDNNYRLLTYKRGPISGTPVVQNTYSYDAGGNRTAANLNGVNTTYTSNNLNQLTSISSGGQLINFTYDGTGNLTYDGNFYKSYDKEGRLLKDSSSPSNVLTYGYDVLGRRVQKNYNGNFYKYTYSGLSQIEERNSSNNLLNRTVFTNFLSPLLNEKNNSSYYYHQNELHSVEAITNSAGQLTERYQYDAYGKPAIYDASNNLLSSSLAGNRFGFTGQEYDSATGNYKFQFRNYSPATGTFLQRDPIGYGDGMGVYQYVHNNPANGIDPLGLEEDEDVDVETYFGKDPCYHDANKVKLITQKILQEEISNATSNAQESKGAVESGFGIGTFQYYTGSSWISYGINSDSKFYNGNLAHLTGENSYNFKGRNVRSWELNYYFTNSSLANAGFSEGTAATYTQTWNDGKAYLSALWPGNWSSAADRLEESVIKQEMVSEAYRDKSAGGDNTVPNLPKELDFNNYGEFGAFFPVINPRTGEISREFFVSRKIKRSQLELLKKFLKKNCPPNDNTGGTQKRRPFPPGFVGPVEIISAKDPNEIIGPDGAPDKKWVSVKDRLPYTILYENHKQATAPAKAVKIVYPIPAKQDPATFQLSNFGFNSLTFNVTPGLVSYYQRLDARDSLGLYIDVTAGYDQINNQAFWQFQSIDPVTLLPPADPLKGFLLLQDSTNNTSGHGFVNFTIKPISAANTGDTIDADADIIFDTNETIPTNVAKNTIDAVAPTSNLNDLPAFNSNNTFSLSWSGIDDANGSGLRSYTLYVAVNGGGYAVVRSGITRTDTTFTGINNNTYSFFVLATDNAGNVEALRPGAEKVIFISSGTLPVTWLTFTATRRDKDGILNWSTATELNAKEFIVERSNDGINFTSIGKVNARGTGTVQSNYLYTDKNILSLNASVVYYRLKQVNNDGNYTYSNIVALQLPQSVTAPVVRAYPNPFSETLAVMIANATVGKNDLVQVYTLDGKQIYQRKIGQRTLDAAVTLNDLPILPAGTYVLNLVLNKQKFSFKIIKQ